MNTTFNTILRTCSNKCIPEEYGESDLTKGESVCIDRCVAKYFKANVKIGTVSIDLDPTVHIRTLTSTTVCPTEWSDAGGDGSVPPVPAKMMLMITPSTCT
ncbi:CYFA0S01e10110g1_1 [Cyberlindnera fabianii]|nr:CYFA0S01e10110g1_1 [Cyberlindnera fabianii]